MDRKESGMKLKPIDSQVVAVVGAASGIGRETALELVRRGASVAVFDNDPEGLETLVAEIQRQGGTVTAVSGDVADYEQVRAFAHHVAGQFGRIDTWAHVVGVGIYATFRETKPEEFRRLIEVNLMGQVYGAQVALPYLARQGGALIHVSSVEARRSLPYHSAYAASKHAITGFTEALRLELQHEKVPVSVTEILPASINTPFFDKAKTKIGVKPIGVPPLYAPRTVAEAILYAAEHPVRELIVGGAGKMLVYGQRLSPRLVDALLLRVGFSSQKTDERKPASAPNDLYGPVERYNTAEGDFGSKTFTHSASTWLDTHPQFKALATVGVAAGIGALIASRRENETRREPGLTVERVQRRVASR